jgi:DNA-binding transcriptional ArsR family regulator
MPDQLSNTFAALADPTRRAILARLASGEASVTELAKPFAMSMPAISKHLKVLERAGLVAHGRVAQWRPRRLEPTALKEVHDWVEHYRQFWEQSFDRLDAYLVQLKKDQLKQDQPTNENLKTDAPKADNPSPHGSKKEKIHKEKKACPQSKNKIVLPR